MLHADPQRWWMPAPTSTSSRDDRTATLPLKFISPGGTSSRTVWNDAKNATLLIFIRVANVWRS